MDTDGVYLADRIKASGIPAPPLSKNVTAFSELQLGADVAFIKDNGAMSAPLWDLLSKNVDFKMNEKEITALDLMSCVGVMQIFEFGGVLRRASARS